MQNTKEEYPFVVKVSYSNHAPMYYNSAHYSLFVNLDYASKYKSRIIAKKDAKYAECQGGKGTVSLFQKEKTKYKERLKQLQ